MQEIDVRTHREIFAVMMVALAALVSQLFMSLFRFLPESTEEPLAFSLSMAANFFLSMLFADWIEKWRWNGYLLGLFVGFYSFVGWIIATIFVP